MGMEVYWFTALVLALLAAIAFGAVFAKRKWLDTAMELMEVKHKELLIFEDGLRDMMEAFELYVVDARKELEQVAGRGAQTQNGEAVPQAQRMEPAPAPIVEALPAKVHVHEDEDADGIVRSIAELEKKGLSQQDIARRLGISNGEAALARRLEGRVKTRG